MGNTEFRKKTYIYLYSILYKKYILDVFTFLQAVSTSPFLLQMFGKEDLSDSDLFMYHIVNTKNKMHIFDNSIYIC